MKHRKTAHGRSTAETILRQSVNNHGLRPLIAKDGRVVGLITDDDICNTAAKVICVAPEPIAPKAERVFPCKSDETVRAELNSLIGMGKIKVEVAGGIVRHSIR
jgi:hypothetical protein